VFEIYILFYLLFLEKLKLKLLIMNILKMGLY
jgi:hypothetical protein